MSNQTIKPIHNFMIQEDTMCIMSVEHEEKIAVWGFFKNIFEIRDNVWMRLFMDVSENGLDNPDKLFIAEGMAVMVSFQ